MPNIPEDSAQRKIKLGTIFVTGTKTCRTWDPPMPFPDPSSGTKLALTVDNAMPDATISNFGIVRGVFFGRGSTFDMSWRATAYVKKLTEHPDGTRLEAREKLVLFVLADYHNDDRNCAWAGLTAIARDSLTSRRYIHTLLHRLEEKGTIRIKRRHRETNLYFFCGIPKEAATAPRDMASPPREPSSLPLGKQLQHPPRELATAPQPPLNRQDSKSKHAHVVCASESGQVTINKKKEEASSDRVTPRSPEKRKEQEQPASDSLLPDLTEKQTPKATPTPPVEVKPKASKPPARPDLTLGIVLNIRQKFFKGRDDELGMQAAESVWRSLGCRVDRIGVIEALEAIVTGTKETGYPAILLRRKKELQRREFVPRTEGVSASGWKPPPGVCPKCAGTGAMNRGGIGTFCDCPAGQKYLKKGAA